MRNTKTSFSSNDEPSSIVSNCISFNYITFKCPCTLAQTKRHRLDIFLIKKKIWDNNATRCVDLGKGTRSVSIWICRLWYRSDKMNHGICDCHCSPFIQHGSLFGDLLLHSIPIFRLSWLRRQRMTALRFLWLIFTLLQSNYTRNYPLLPIALTTRTLNCSLPNHWQENKDIILFSSNVG